MRVITFSKAFPATHPRAGEPTHFVQKILHSQLPKGYEPATQIGWPPKFHTIRKGNRWKEGDQFSARIWTGAPYRSKQEEFCQLAVKKVWQIKIYKRQIWINSEYVHGCNMDLIERKLAQNDGLRLDDFWAWFDKITQKESFTGQIICWSDKIEYQ